MKPSFLLSFAIAATLLLSCKKTLTELPPATQTGANTFGAKINGDLWMPKGYGPFPANNLLEARWSAGLSIYINARNFESSPNETEFELYIKNVTAPGVYPLNTTLAGPSQAASYGYYVKRNVTPQNEWLTSAQYPGSVTITRVDTVAGIVSGTFQFNAINLYNTPQPITVTEGRFDVRTQ